MSGTAGQENFSVWKKCFFSFLDKITILAFHLLLNVRQNKIRLLCSLVPGYQMNWFQQSFEFSEKMGEDQCNLKHLEMTVKKQMGFFLMNRYVSVTQPWCSQLWNAYFVTHSTSHYI